MTKIISMSTKSTVTIVTVGLLSAGLYGCNDDNKDPKPSCKSKEPTCTQNTTKFEQFFNFSKAQKYFFARNDSDKEPDKESKEVYERCGLAGGEWHRQFEDAQTSPTKISNLSFEEVTQDLGGRHPLTDIPVNFVAFSDGDGAVGRYYERASGTLKCDTAKKTCSLTNNDATKASVKVTKENWHKYQVVTQHDVKECVDNGGLPSVDLKHDKTDVACATLPQYLRENFGADNIDTEDQCEHANKQAMNLIYKKADGSSSAEDAVAELMKKVRAGILKTMVTGSAASAEKLSKPHKLFDWQFGQCVLAHPCEMIWEPVALQDVVEEPSTGVHKVYKYCKAKHEKKAEDKNVQCLGISRLDDACVVDAQSNTCGYYGYLTPVGQKIGAGMCQFTKGCSQASAPAKKAGDKKAGDKKVGDKKAGDKKGDDEEADDEK